MKVIILLVLFVVLNAAEINLKKGWNLIGISSIDDVSVLKKNSHILKAAGGGVGGGGNFRYDKNFAQYASGTMILGQGYWIKVDTDTSFSYTEVTKTLSSIEFKKGWNLVNVCVEIDASKLLSKYPHILKAAGGGVGGGGDFRYDKDYAQYASGVTKPNQGYWFKVDEAFSMECDTQCAQVLSYAMDPSTQECKEFSTPCDIPSEWIACEKETSPMIRTISTPPAIPAI